MLVKPFADSKRKAWKGKASPSWKRGCGFGVSWLLRAQLWWGEESVVGGENLKMFFWSNEGFGGEGLDPLILENKNGLHWQKEEVEADRQTYFLKIHWGRWQKWGSDLEDLPAPCLSWPWPPSKIMTPMSVLRAVSIGYELDKHCLNPHCKVFY